MWPGVRSRWRPSPCLPLRPVQGARPRAGAGVAEITPSWLGSGPQTLDSGVDLDPQTQAVEAWLPVHQFDGESRSFGNANRVSPRRAGGPRAQLTERPHAASSAEKEEPDPPASPRGSGGVQPGLGTKPAWARILVTNSPVAPLTDPCRASGCSPVEWEREASRPSRHAGEWP